MATLNLLEVVSLFAVAMVVVTLGWRILNSPLNAADDAHWSVRLTGAWIWWQRITDKDAQAVHDAHVRLGPAVRLGPKELSINDVDGGLKPIYDGRLPKTDFYDVANSYGESPMVAIRDEKQHQMRKRLVAKPYAKSTVMHDQAWNTEQGRLADELVKALDEQLKTSSDIELYDIFYAWAVTTTSAYIFGANAGLNLLGNISEARRVREEYFTQRTPQFISAVLPIPTIFRQWTGTQAEIQWIWQSQERAEKAVQSAPKQTSEDRWTSVYSFMKKSMSPETSKQDPPAVQLSAKETAIVSSELQDHMIAGIDTSIAALGACAWLLSIDSNRQWQHRLREEVKQVPTTASFAQLEQLPVLNAIVKETLRLFPPVAGGQPRVTDKPVLLGPEGHRIHVPAGIKVHSQALTLHRSEVFERPDLFCPERWLDSSPDRVNEMERWFWAFGSGTRRCVGEHLGLSNIRFAIATIWRTFETRETQKTKFTVGKGTISMSLPNGGDFIRLRVERVGS
ncbi:hypothetical protein LTR37_012214 [Vermiconidia calcicola]|uniref:Uncharacterized protein n=1 Tax=Vermiconidia calcicola TaxID=1690605 RepID=A0ACC3N020_9PEZI|nr:hypothetical protein LTR37_012214 [Vermiconidia calcicola]